ncbi:MAG: BTAD domain-containing putative transcriptional regulator [Burkholderiales bacterium]
MNPIRLSVLGGFEMWSPGGAPVQLPPKKARALLAYLALSEFRPQPRDKLAALLWEDSSESQARTSLRQSLTAIRRALPDADSLLDADNEQIVLRRDSLEVDAQAFQQYAAASSAERLREAVELYRGHLLDGFDVRAPAFEDWLRAERERLRNLAVSVLDTLVDHHHVSGSHAEALAAATRLLALDPLREQTHRSVMRIYAAQGRHPQAIEQYRRCREALRLELGVNPDPQTEELYREIVEQRRAPSRPQAVPPTETPAAGGDERSQSGPQLRHATVFLIDIDGFTAFASETDPEDLHDFLTRYRRMVRTRAQEEGGTVTNYIQARVMVVFGVPVAYGNDAERAVRAALSIRDEVPRLSNAAGSAFRIRVGVASGAVLTSQDETGFTITGEPVSVAARIMESAAGGEMRVANEVVETIGERLIAEYLPNVTVAGVTWPLPVWRALELTRQADEAGVFVGREPELRQLEALLNACDGSGTGRTVLIRGEAGIGKSQLAQEVMRRARGLGFACHRISIVEFGGTGARPAIELSRSLLGVSARDDAGALSFALNRAIDGNIVTPDLQQSLAEMLGLPQKNEPRRIEETADSVARTRGRHAVLGSLVKAAAAAGPLLVIAEDVHWADALTLDFLATVASVARGARVLLAMTARSESDPIGSAWRAACGGCPLTTIDLGPLSDEEAMQLAENYSGNDAEFARNCVERAAGNPLFLDQLLRAERASGVLPGSLQSLVLARLDRLHQQDREALQAAAVLGQRFSLEVLRHLTGDPDYLPDRMVEQGLLRPESGDYVFGHALIREAVYGSILKSQRIDLHESAARWFAKRNPALEAEHLGAIGHPGAPGAFLRAARAEAANFRTQRALLLIAQGMGFASEPGDRCDLLLERGDALRDLGETERSVQAFGEALHEAQNDSQRCRAWIGIAAGLRILDRYDRALAALEHAEELATALDDTRALMHIHSLRGNIHFPRGDIDGCLRAHEVARALALKLGSRADEARALSGLGDAYYQSARVLTAQDYFRRCIELARAERLARVEAMNLSMIGITSFYCQSARHSIEHCQSALERAARIGELRAEVVAYDVLCGVLLMSGDPEGALAAGEHALKLTQRMGARRFEADAYLGMALSMHALGDVGESVRLISLAEESLAETGTGFSGPWVMASKATVVPDRDAKLRALAEGAAMLERGCVAHCHFHFHQLAIDIMLDLQDWEAAGRHAQALEKFTAAEPLPWSDFVVARGRALARHGRGERGAAIKAERLRLTETARALGLKPMMPALEAAAN